MKKHMMNTKRSNKADNGTINNLIISDNLYFDGDKGKVSELIKKFTGNVLTKKYYLVCFLNDENKPVIFGSNMLRNKHYQDKRIELAGIFKSEDDAFEYIRCIVSLSYRKFKELKFKETINTFDPSDVANLFYNEENL